MKPLIDLHLHLDGSLRLQTILDIAKRENVKLPADNLRDLKRKLRCGKLRHSLADYLSAFPITLSVLQSRYALERAAAELLEDCAAEGLKYVEVRFAPFLHTRYDLSAGDAVEAVMRGLERGMKHGIKANLILCSLRHHEPKESEAVAYLAHAYKDGHGGVVAIDMAGDDSLAVIWAHCRAFRWAVNHGLKVTFHAGETGPPDEIIQAALVCGARRIGHGTTAILDPKVMDFLQLYRIPLEVCLTSNLQTRASGWYSDHPARTYLKRGLLVTLNTDNRLLAGTTLEHEFNRALVAWPELDKAGVRQLQLNAIDAAFAPADWKMELYRALDAPA